MPGSCCRSCVAVGCANNAVTRLPQWMVCWNGVQKEHAAKKQKKQTIAAQLIAARRNRPPCARQALAGHHADTEPAAQSVCTAGTHKQLLSIAAGSTDTPKQTHTALPPAAAHPPPKRLHCRPNDQAPSSAQDCSQLIISSRPTCCCWPLQAYPCAACAPLRAWPGVRAGPGVLP